MDGAGFELPRGCRTELSVGVGMPRLMAVGRNHPRRAELEAFIAERYRTAYGARIRRFMPQLFALLGADGELEAAAGLRRGDERPLFVEQYLDQPVEALLAARFDRSVDRERVCEIGHLCGTGHGIGRRLFPLLACWMHEQGIEWAVFAATSTLRQMFERMQVRPLPLAPATGERLGAAMADWGSYYDTDPWVVGGPLQLGQRLMDLPR